MVSVHALFVETVGLYADNMILYIADTGHSLQAALQTIEEFGTHSLLHINWRKSQILPLDSYPPTSSSAFLPLNGVSLIQYLGVQVTRVSQEYITNNIEQFFNILKTNTQSWARLPLGVMVRVNLTKIILLPKFLYMFWHSPVLIPPKIFKTILIYLGTWKA